MTLRVSGLSALRGSFSLDVPDWTAPAGEFRVLLGRNGAGKSSFFDVLSGGLRHRGELSLHGRALAEWPAKARARHLAVLLQQSGVPFAFTAEEVVALGLTPLRISHEEARHRVQHCMERAGCAELAGRSYPALSGGERQRVNLARVLLQVSDADATPVLLLDEPTSAQDLAQQHAMLETLRALAHDQGFAVVAVLHDLNHALRYADHCAVLAGGRLIAQGVPDDVLRPDAIEQVWGYRPQAVEAGGRAILV